MTATRKWRVRRPEARVPDFGRIRWNVLLLVLLPIPLLLLLGPYLRGMLNGTLEEDACLVEPADIAGNAVYLLDLRKPLNPAHRSLPGNLLRDVSHEIEANTELRVFALTRYAESPRMLIGRLCKPYDNADLKIATAKDQGNGSRDCDDVPAQVSVSLRDKANRFCAQRDGLQRRIDVLVQQQRDGRVANAYVAEAVEDTFRDFEDVPGARSLYIFSDMLQHASWYSHLDLRWEDWSFEEFAAIREKRAALIGDRAPVNEDLSVRVFYVPRTGSTENLRVRVVHKQFWEDYFAGADLDFDDRASMVEFGHEALMDVPSAAEIAAQERERVRYEREAVEALRTRMEEEKLALESVRQRLTDQTRQLEVRERELRQERDLLEEEKTQLAAEGQPDQAEGG